MIVSLIESSTTSLVVSFFFLSLFCFFISVMSLTHKTQVKHVNIRTNCMCQLTSNLRFSSQMAEWRDSSNSWTDFDVST